MRLAAVEMRYGRDVPVSVAINEAVELAKKYGTEESGRFVNGVLGALARRQSPEGEETPAG
jgi:N utilization substance protein B